MRKKKCSGLPPGAGGQGHNVPVPVEQRAQCHFASVNREGEGRRIKKEKEDSGGRW